jgi:hypothetical protein
LENEQEEMWREAVVAYFKILGSHLKGEVKETKKKKPSVRSVGASGWIRTRSAQMWDSSGEL